MISSWKHLLLKKLGALLVSDQKEILGRNPEVEGMGPREGKSWGDGSVSIVHAPVSNVHAPVSNMHAAVSNVHAPVSNMYTPVSNMHVPVSNRHTSVSNEHAPSQERACFSQ